ncbi:hypothetical protein C7M84_020081 [Penaeus vannamei]|uniref:Uncharacterized protein n=1 Tax=Penaeus vannamei TaxID=6689 RepID=A0A423SCW0_PENVA|nr:hypothetical protein C7M84_020081 [Penaeus vannamei]
MTSPDRSPSRFDAALSLSAEEYFADVNERYLAMSEEQKIQRLLRRISDIFFPPAFRLVEAQPNVDIDRTTTGDGGRGKPGCVRGSYSRQPTAPTDKCHDAQPREGHGGATPEARTSSSSRPSLWHCRPDTGATGRASKHLPSAQVFSSLARSHTDTPAGRKSTSSPPHTPHPPPPDPNPIPFSLPPSPPPSTLALLSILKLYNPNTRGLCSMALCHLNLAKGGSGECIRLFLVLFIFLIILIVVVITIITTYPLSLLLSVSFSLFLLLIIIAIIIIPIPPTISPSFRLPLPFSPLLHSAPLSLQTHTTYVVSSANPPTIPPSPLTTPPLPPFSPPNHPSSPSFPYSYPPLPPHSFPYSSSPSPPPPLPPSPLLLPSPLFSPFSFYRFPIH